VPKTLLRLLIPKTIVVLNLINHLLLLEFVWSFVICNVMKWSFVAGEGSVLMPMVPMIVLVLKSRGKSTFLVPSDSSLQ
jgi:hypothetical protein